MSSSESSGSTESHHDSGAVFQPEIDPVSTSDPTVPHPVRGAVGHGRYATTCVSFAAALSSGLACVTSGFPIAGFFLLVLAAALGIEIVSLNGPVSVLDVSRPVRFSLEQGGLTVATPGECGGTEMRVVPLVRVSRVDVVRRRCSFEWWGAGRWITTTVVSEDRITNVAQVETPGPCAFLPAWCGCMLHGECAYLAATEIGVEGSESERLVRISRLVWNGRQVSDLFRLASRCTEFLNAYRETPVPLYII